MPIDPHDDTAHKPHDTENTALRGDLAKEVRGATGAKDVLAVTTPPVDAAAREATAAIALPRADSIARKYAALSPTQRQQFRRKAHAQQLDWTRLPVMPLNDGSADVATDATSFTAQTDPRGDADAGTTARDSASRRRYPVSPAQLRLWFLWRLDPSSPAYNLSQAVRLEGRLDATAMRQAFSAVVARHGALRTVFTEENGAVWQSVRPMPEKDVANVFEFQVIEDDADRDRLRERLRVIARTPFDLTRGPLLRVTLLRSAPETHRMVIVTHHIVSDGWSQKILLSELAQAYDVAIRGGDPTIDLPPTTIHAADVAAWRDEWMRADGDGTDTSRTDDALQFWKTRLAPCARRAPIALPLDRPRGVHRGVEGGRERIAVDGALLDSLRAFARAQRTSLFTVLLSTYAATLYRYGALRDIGSDAGDTPARLPIGVPFAGRDDPTLHPVIGYFVNTIVLDPAVDGAMSGQSLVQAVHRRLGEAQAHAHVPFGQILDVLNVSREVGRAPLFQVMFNLEQGGGREAVAKLSGLTASGEDGGTDTARFDLVLNAVDQGDGVALLFHYAADVFDAATIARFAADYRGLLTAMIADPQARIGALSVASSSYREPHCYPYESVVSALRAQALRTPEAVAVRCEGGNGAGFGRRADGGVPQETSLTYGALEAWSGRIALRLRAAGVCAETRVGLCVGRGPALIAGMLGIWRAGGAFVPLDPSYPLERLVMMREDAGIAQVVGDEASVRGVASLFDEVTLIDVGSACEGEEVMEAPVAALHPSQLAYVLYTSGSTGRPKGVAVEHEALWVHLQDFLSTYEITAEDVVLHSSTINFDVALHEIVPALLRGARIEMRGEQPWDLRSLSARLVGGGVTFARIPTALWQQWQHHAPARELLKLRQVTVGGEALPGDALAVWQGGALGDIALDNLYGPTETTVAALYRRTQASDASATTVPIGIAYPGRTARVLDAFGDIAPVGGLGELCIGGPTVARGYLGRASQTAERFVPDPYGAPGARQYRSGDLCRMQADGCVGFLGRLDQQVKLRGQRIELGEIEAALRSCEGVREAAVIVTGTGAQQRLAAYVAGEGEGESQGVVEGQVRAGLDGGVIREVLQRKLPSYMVPTSVMVLEKLPSMPNGKLDRGALPLVQEGVFGGERTQARNDEEQTLLGIWRAVLGREDVGVTENFFEAGGDSIQSLQIIARAREAGWVLTPRQIFDYPTVAEQVVQWTPASATASADDVDDVADAYDADAGDAPTSLPLTPIQQWFFLRYPHGESHWNQSVLLQVAGPLDLAALEQAVDLLRRRHDALRLRFTRDIVIDGDEKHDAETALAKPGTPHASPDPRYTWRQTVLPASIAERDLVWRQHLVGWDALPEAGEAVQRSLDLTHGPIWRVAYFTLADAEPKADTRLLLTAHHLAVDGVSWRILLDELRQAYEQIVAGNTTSNGTDAGAMLGASADAHATHLPNRSWSWRRWTRALSAYAKEPARLAELPWWQTALRETTQGAASLSAPLFHTLSNTAAPQQTVLRRLSPTLTDALLRIPGALTSRSAPSGIRTAPSPTRPAIRVEDCLLGAFASAICAHADRGRLLVEIEGHGREDVVGGADLSRTVGWFTTQYPIVVTHQLAPAAMVASVRDVMARVPARGIHWGLLTQQADAASIAAVRALPQPQVSFNYLGRFDSTLAADTAESPPSRFGFAAESAGRATAPSTQGPDRVLDLNAWISNGRLSVSWGYAPQYLDEARVTSIADAFEAVIAALVDADASHNVAHQVPGTSAYEMAGSGDVSHAASTPLVASPRAPREAEALLTALPSPVRLPAVPNHLRQAALSEPTLSAWVTRADIEHALLSIPAVSPGFSTWSGSTQRRTALLDIARDAAREADSLPLIPMNALGAPWTVFCLHPGYGMVAEYCSVARALNGIATVVGVQAPALRGCPWDGATLEALAAHYADAIAAWCADADAGAAKAVSFPGGHPRGAGRIGLLGWSFGGRLAAAMLAAPGTISFDFVGIVDTATQLAASGGADTDAPLAAGTGTPSLTDSVRTGAPSLLRAAFEADAMHTRLLHGHLLPSLQSNLFFWRAARSGVAQPTVGEKAGDTSVTSAQTPTAVHQDVPVRRSDWQHVTSGVVVERSVDATHTSIVHHPTFLAQLHETLANIAHEG